MSAADVAAWFALGLALVELAFIVGVVVLVLRLWRRVAPQVLPVVSMFAGPPATSRATRPWPATSSTTTTADDELPT